MAPVTPVRKERTSTTQQVGPEGEDPGPKLLVDLSLIAPRPTERETGATIARTDGSGESERCALRTYQDRSSNPSSSRATSEPVGVATGEPVGAATGVDVLA
jgi:hypothetical protein